jgi:hypothetical protein
MFKKSSPLKLLGQMEPNLAGSIYARSSMVAIFVGRMEPNEEDL